MKKLLANAMWPLVLFVLLIPGLSIISCQKENVIANENPDLQNTSQLNAELAKKGITTVEAYNSVIYDSCRNENVFLTGQMISKVIESFDRGYYLNYEIRLDKISGIGEVTGTIYHGGGRISGVVKQNEDATKVKGKVTYRVKFIAKKGKQISFTQTARFIMVNGQIKVDFNNVYDTCK
jgi:hypothetical protein